MKAGTGGGGGQHQLETVSKGPGYRTGQEIRGQKSEGHKTKGVTVREKGSGWRQARE